MITIKEIIENLNQVDQYKLITTPLKKYTTFEEACTDEDAPYWWYFYACKLGRFLDGEPTILTSSKWSFFYANDIIKGRWRVAEPVILTSPEFTFWYAFKIIKGRWEEGEQTILTSPQFACYYAIDIIKGRWKEAESIVLSSDKWYQYYNSECNHLKSYK